MLVGFVGLFEIVELVGLFEIVGLVGLFKIVRIVGVVCGGWAVWGWLGSRGGRGGLACVQGWLGLLG